MMDSKTVMKGLLGMALVDSFGLSVARNNGASRRSLGPSGTPRRNQERAIKRMAQRSRAINRMKRK